MQNTSPDTAVTPPDAPTVMYFTYQVDGDGATSYEVQNGSVATFWFGHTFTRWHYVPHGFLLGYPRALRQAWRADAAGPDDRANLAEATFVLAGTDAKKPWKFRGQEWTIGALGAYDKADDVDTRRKPLEHRTADGRLLLAVPTSSLTAASAAPAMHCCCSTPGAAKTTWTARSGAMSVRCAQAKTTAPPATKAT